MRILHIQKTAGVSGSERHLLTLLPALAARGVEVRMCVLAIGEAHRFVDALHAVGVEAVTVPAGSHLNPLLVPRLRREIRSFGADIVHTHLVHADSWGVPAARLARVPAVSSVHDVAKFYQRRAVGFGARRIGQLITERIAISQFVASYLLGLGLADPRHLTVVHYGIETGAWQRTDTQVAAARARFGIDDTACNIGIASRLIPGKGHAAIIEAVQVLRSRPAGRPVKLLIAGDGPLRAELTALAGPMVESGDVRFFGFINDIAEFMSACDVITFPTSRGFAEGFGLAALEAMAAGRPVVAANSGPLPEIVDQSAGLLIDPDSVEMAVDAFTRLADDPALCRQLGRGAQQRAATAFTVERMVDQTIAVYERARAGRG